MARKPDWFGDDTSYEPRCRLMHRGKRRRQHLQVAVPMHPRLAVAGALTPATAFEGKFTRGNLGWWWLRVRGRHGP